MKWENESVRLIQPGFFQEWFKNESRVVQLHTHDSLTNSVGNFKARLSAYSVAYIIRNNFSGC